MKQWLDRLIAIAAFAALAIFLAVPVFKVAEIDLTIVIVVVLVLAGVDFALSIIRRNGNGRS